MDDRDDLACRQLEMLQRRIDQAIAAADRVLHNEALLARMDRLMERCAERKRRDDS